MDGKRFVTKSVVGHYQKKYAHQGLPEDCLERSSLNTIERAVELLRGGCDVEDCYYERKCPYCKSVIEFLAQYHGQPATGGE